MYAPRPTVRHMRARRPTPIVALSLSLSLSDRAFLARLLLLLPNVVGARLANSRWIFSESLFLM